MNKLELAKKLLGYAVYNDSGYRTTEDFFDALENRANETMVYLKVFWKGTRFNYQWGQGFVTDQDKESYSLFVEELANQVDFLHLTENKYSCADVKHIGIDPSAGFEHSAVGSSYVYSEPMNFTFIVSVEKAVELFAAIEEHHGSDMVRSISLIEFFNPLHMEDIDAAVESKREQAQAEFVERLAKIKRGYCAHLPTVVGLSLMDFRRNSYDNKRTEATDVLFKKIDELNESIRHELMALGVLALKADDFDYVSFMNKTDFRKTYSATDRKNIYAKMPQLKEYFEPTPRKKAE